jgi:hypothetical protein
MGITTLKRQQVSNKFLTEYEEYSQGEVNEYSTDL